MKALFVIVAAMLASGGSFAAAPRYTYIEADYKYARILPATPHFYGDGSDGIRWLDPEEKKVWIHGLVTPLESFDLDHAASISASVELNEIFYVFGEYSQGEFEFESHISGSLTEGELISDYDFTSTQELSTEAYSFGIGVRDRLINDNTTWHFEMGRWESDTRAVYDTQGTVVVHIQPGTPHPYESHDDIRQETNGLFVGAGIRSNVIDDLELHAGFRLFAKDSAAMSDLFTAGAIYSPEWAHGLGLTANVTYAEADDTTTYGIGIRYTFK